MLCVLSSFVFTTKLKWSTVTLKVFIPRIFPSKSGGMKESSQNARRPSQASSRLSRTVCAANQVLACTSVIGRAWLRWRLGYTVIPNVKNPPKHKYTQGDFTNFPWKFLHIHITSVSGCLRLIFKICQTVAGISTISQLHEFLNLVFGGFLWYDATVH